MLLWLRRVNVESIHFKLERRLSPSLKWPGVANSQVYKQTRKKKKRKRFAGAFSCSHCRKYYGSVVIVLNDTCSKFGFILLWLYVKNLETALQKRSGF